MIDTALDWSLYALMGASCLMALYKRSVAGALFICPLVITALIFSTLTANYTADTLLLITSLVSVVSVIAIIKTNSNISLHLVWLLLAAILANGAGLYVWNNSLDLYLYQPLYIAIYLISLFIIGKERGRTKHGFSMGLPGDRIFGALRSQSGDNPHQEKKT